MTGYRLLTNLFTAALLCTLLAHGAIAQSSTKAMPTDSIGVYDALSNGTSVTLGDTMKLSRTSAQFSLLKGEMKLKYSDVWKNIDNTEFGGDVYQVLNADEFFSLNKGKNGFCDKPVRWVTIRNLNDSLGEGAIRVGMLSIDDWRTYNANSLGACSADSFTLK
ncbi:hypothetical protein [Pseudomonas syringae group genomosp. 3]|uniref:hypothetical protein n=1 Tax=Pseudomonas syringae group genomosp. 3 TaxID=251701 RepID=UPI000EFE78B4|nr:hypothetical protein [Pseudomonas syringae group genomosp. 3]